MIGIDWGTTSLRAYLFRGSHVLDRRDAARGITQVAAGAFASVLRETVGDWLAAGETRILMAGMIGSRQGWVEAPYLACPAGLEALAGSLTPVPFESATVAIVPGVQHRDAAGVPEVMRGEETQLASILADIEGDALVCLPGTHSKWASVSCGEIVGFSTAMTGEVFAALRGHTILGRMMQDGPVDPSAFRRGVARAAEPGGLLHHLFGVRTLGLFGALTEAEASSYLSGLLIGHEVAAAGASGAVHLIGAPSLSGLYALALEARDVQAIIAPADAASTGLAIIAERAGWM